MSEIDWNAYKQGMEASKKHDSNTSKADNPYKEGTDKFYSWRRGWNQHYNEEWSKQ